MRRAISTESVGEKPQNRGTFSDKVYTRFTSSHSPIIARHESILDIRCGGSGSRLTAEITCNERDIPRFPTFRRPRGKQLASGGGGGAPSRLICRRASSFPSDIPSAFCPRERRVRASTARGSRRSLTNSSGNLRVFTFRSRSSHRNR